jgi:two-component sensor histidine kinase
VCDEGPGLPPNLAAGDAGQGLGMRVVETLTRQLKGNLEARANRNGRGSCFTVTFEA